VRINYKDDMQFSVTFDNGTESEVQDIPPDGTALVCTPDGKKLAVVATGNHDGPLTANTTYVLSASSTTVTGKEPSKMDYEMIEDEDEDDDLEGDEDDGEEEGELGDEEEEE
jgi:hypothetical protein